MAVGRTRPRGLEGTLKPITARTGPDVAKRRATRLALPVVASDGSRFDAKGIQQSDDITDQMKQRELVDRLRAVCLTITTHVGATAWKRPENAWI